METAISLICKLYGITNRKSVELRYSELNGWDWVCGEYNSYITHNDGFWTLRKLNAKLEAMMPVVEPTLVQRLGDLPMSQFTSEVAALLREVYAELSKNDNNTTK